MEEVNKHERPDLKYQKKKVYLKVRLLLGRMRVSPVSVYFSSIFLGITLHKYENCSPQQNLFSTYYTKMTE